MVALEGERVVGYQTGYSGIPALKGSATGVWVPVWGHCIDNLQDAGVIYAALYAQMSAQWVRRQCYTHVMSYFLPDNALQELLFGLGFGLLLIDGIRSLSPIAATGGDDCEVRAAVEADSADLLELDRKIANHLSSAPVFLPFDAIPPEELPRKFLGQGIGTFVARKDDRAISCIRGEVNMGPGCDLFDVDGSLGINFAFTDPATRKQGVATRLLNELMRWGAAEGMTRCVVDFESANLVAKEFWLRHFQPACHSVIRRVDERV